MGRTASLIDQEASVDADQKYLLFNLVMDYS